MNFLQLLASGASILNFNFQSKSPQPLDSISKPWEKSQGFKKVDPHPEIDNLASLPQQIPSEQATLLNQMLYNERQELINRYLQLNLRLLEGKIQKPESPVEVLNSQKGNDEGEEKQELGFQGKNANSKKKIKKAVKCGHDDKAHYAKGMCNNCYHKYGRTKKPWNCSHDKLYAGGMCQNCYINMYNKKKREEQHPVDERAEQPDQTKENLIIFREKRQEGKEMQQDSREGNKQQSDLNKENLKQVD